MELLDSTQSIFIGLIGWAATVLLVMNATKLSASERRAVSVFVWCLWVIPTTGALVYQGLITIDSAVMFCGVTAASMAALAMLSSISWRTRP